MCVTSRLQQHIRNLTKDGEIVARFLVDTVQGKHPDAKYHHKLEAAKLLERYGSTDDDPSHEEKSHFWGLIPTPEELAQRQDSQTENSELNTHNSPVTHLDILNYEIAHLIRKETAEGHTIAEFLGHVMTRQDKPFTPKKLRIRHIDRFTAAMEILRRGHGHFGRRRKLVVDDYDTNDYDTLHTDLAKRMREYSEHGTDAIRFLLDVMSATDPDEPYTWHHRVSAAQELIRRGWDTNYDRITPEMLQAYWRNQQSSRLSIGQKKHLVGLPTTLDDYNTYDNEDYQAIADTIREQEDREAAEGSKSLPPRRGKVRMGVKGPESNLLANPAGQGKDARDIDTPSPLMGEGWDGGEEPHLSQSTPISDESNLNEDDFDDQPDCYHEPLNPDKQAIFDYQTQIESGDYEEGEITLRQSTPEDWKAYEQALAHITEIAAAEGVPLLPNPLADTLTMPNIRSP